MNVLIQQLSQIGAISEERLQPYFPRVRDREDIAVLRDYQCEVIVLSGILIRQQPPQNSGRPLE